MFGKKVRIAGAIFSMMLVGLMGVVAALNVSIGRVYAQVDVPRDMCGRSLYHRDTTPWNYRTPCPISNGAGLIGGIGPAANDRFEPPYLAYSTGGSWVEAVSLDNFDQDGSLDIALSTSSYFDPARDQRVWVARQNNPSSFSLAYSATVGALDPQSLDVADMNGDSYLDLVVANAHGGASGKGDVEIFWGKGNYAFTRTDHLAGDTPYAVAVVPVHTKTLAVVTNWNDVILSSYLGGIGYMVTSTSYAAPQAGWNQLAMGDLNHDGHLDIAAMWGQTYAVPAFTEYFGNGQGSLSPGPSFPKDNQNPSAIGVGQGQELCKNSHRRSDSAK